MKTSGDAAAWWRLTAAAMATWLFLWGALAGAEGGPAPAPASAPAGKIKVLMLGDSLTHYGMAPAVEKELAALSEGGTQWSAIDAGVGGEDANRGKDRIGGLLDKERPALVTVAYGANDIAKRFTPQQFRENMEGIVKIIQSHASAPRVVLMTVTPIDANRHSFGKDKKLMDRGGPDYVLETEYNAVTRMLAQEKGLPLVDLHRYAMTAKDPMGLLVKDGIHLTPEAYVFLAKHLAKALSDFYRADVLKDRPALSARAKAVIELLDLRKEQAAGKADPAKTAAHLDAAWEACPYLAEAAALWHKATYPPPATQPAPSGPDAPPPPAPD